MKVVVFVRRPEPSKSAETETRQKPIVLIGMNNQGSIKFTFNQTMS